MFVRSWQRKALRNTQVAVAPFQTFIDNTGQAVGCLDRRSTNKLVSAAERISVESALLSGAVSVRGENRPHTSGRL